MFRRNFSRLTRQRRKTSNILSDKYRKRVAEMPLFFLYFQCMVRLSVLY